MTDDTKLQAKQRDDFGKGASRRYRREGSVPAVVYGSGSEVRHLLLPEHELGLALRGARVVLDIDLDGTRLLVAPRDVQKDPVRDELLHLDLIMLSAADIQERHAYADALAAAEAAAEEAGLDPSAAASIIEEAAENEEDLADVASRIVEILEEQNRLRAEAAAAAEAAEAAKAAAAGVSEEGAEGEDKPAEDSGSSE